MFSWRKFSVATSFFTGWPPVSASAWDTTGCTRTALIECPLWLEYFFAVCGTLTLEGGPIFWVATHRIHHQKSDQPGDPHSPRDGAWWSHMGWIVFGEAKHNNTQLMGKYAPDLAKHRFYRWLNNWHWVPMVVLAVILLAIGGCR